MELKFLPDNLKYLRKSKELSQDEMCMELGEALGFVKENGEPKRSKWSNYETGKSQPDLKSFVKIAKFFGVTESNLLHQNLSSLAAEPVPEYEKQGNDTPIDNLFLVAVRKIEEKHEEIIKTKNYIIEGLEKDKERLEKRADKYEDAVFGFIKNDKTKASKAS
ncbi:MAG TPA: helix-turn-helix transcriptional regulator [Salinimicrobium sp.]|nr:helix-turn-helix transcriptional regulator [Salinimicrobium sp.]